MSKEINWKQSPKPGGGSFCTCSKLDEIFWGDFDEFNLTHFLKRLEETPLGAGDCLAVPAHQGNLCQKLVENWSQRHSYDEQMLPNPDERLDDS